MLRPITNLLYRRKDPTRFWRPDPAVLTVDVSRCTVCNAPVGGSYLNLQALGPSEDARHAARGYPAWYSRGITCCIENERLGDISVALNRAGPFRPFPGRFLNNGQPLPISGRTTPDQLAALLGEPFGRSHNEWDSAMIFFYEFDAGEAQCAFDKNRGTLDMIEFWYDPELSQKGACKAYGVDKPFPDEFRRQLPT